MKTQTRLKFSIDDATIPDILHRSYSPSFIDLCAGIGGGRLGLEKAGFNCLGFAEIEKNALRTYRAFYGNNEKYLADLTKLSASDIPNCELLIAGFPCQSFSIVGKRQGTEDERGKIIFSIAEILRQKSINYFILENVKGLLSLHNGKVMQDIIHLLRGLGYRVYYKLLNSFNFGTPQIRERIYIVGVKENLTHSYFEFPEGEANAEYNLGDFLTDQDESLVLQEDSAKYQTFLKYLNNKYNKNKYRLNEILSQQNLILDTRQSDLRIFSAKIPTLRMGRHGILYVKNNKLRHLSAKEALALQGFDKEYLQISDIVSNNKILSLAGNAMTVPVIEAIARNLKKIIDLNKYEKSRFG